jgi:hypothetical protein
MANEKDLFHGQGNETVALPSHLVGKTVKTNPHATPGKLEKGLTKKVQKGWNK